MKQVAPLLIVIAATAGISACLWWAGNQYRASAVTWSPSLTDSSSSVEPAVIPPETEPVSLRATAAPAEPADASTPVVKSDAEIAAGMLEREGKTISAETFVRACAEGDTGTLELLNTAKFALTNDLLEQGMGAAIGAGKENIIRRLAKAAVHWPLVQQEPALIWALKHDKEHPGLWQVLLDAGAALSDAGQSALLVALESKEEKIVQRLIDLGAPVDVADVSGKTPLMLAAANGWNGVVAALLEKGAPADRVCAGGWSAWNYAIAAERPDIAGQIFQALAVKPEWNEPSRTQFSDAIGRDDLKTVAVLYKNLAPEPVITGSAQPLLAWAIAWRKPSLVRTLLEAGASPNSQVVVPVEEPFVSLITDKNFRFYLSSEKGLTVLMLAAAIGNAEVIAALLEKGAERNRITQRYKMAALSFAAWGNHVTAMQLLLGTSPEELQSIRVEISLSQQRVNLIRDGLVAFTTNCSTGRSGFRTPKGEFVITDKHLKKKSTLYDAVMPYFMRLSGSAVGMHQGYVPDYPASHGCIRLPAAAAKKFFNELPLGTLVVIAD